MTSSAKAPVACLWELEWDDSRLACRIYRNSSSLQLRLESSRAVILSEPFSVEPRALARARALRDNLKRRGWKDTARAPRRPGPDGHRRS